ncbi:MAG TPA: hypothetical protein VFU10_09110, partial [Gaiellaceae bacterium]|nr:hypothetical protein [Gaiellaceae bacterium]
MRARWLLAGLLAVVLAGVVFGGASAFSSDASPTIASDLPDYNPGQTVTLNGTGWESGSNQVHIVVNDTAGVATFLHDVNVDVVNGTVTDSFSLPTYFVASYTVTATQQTSSGGTLTATTTFTDANPSANLDQCANDPAPSPSSDGCDTNANQWVNGNLGASKSFYLEGDSIPYRIGMDNLVSGSSHAITIEWDTTKSSTHALDYITSYNRSVLDANPCLGVSGCNTFSTFPIPADPQVTGAGVTQAAGVFTLFGGTITSVSAYSYPDGAGFTGDKSARITINFTASKTNPVLAWGGHIATRKDWGSGNSAVAIPGSPYHTRLIDLDGSGGNQDRSLSAEAVVFPGSITIIKDAQPNGPTSFQFTASPSPLANFSLVDDGTSANTKLFSNITTFQTYTVQETPIPTGWALTNLVCSHTDDNGGSSSTNLGTGTSTINMAEGENYTCTYTNVLQRVTLTVIKHVINDNGGTKTAGDFTMSVNSATGSPNPASFGGAESPGTSVSIAANAPYNVTEGAVTGYTQTGTSAGCSSATGIPPGGSATCTITNDDNAAHLIVIKHVVNNNGGSKVASDFTTTISGVSTANPSAPGAEAPGVDNTLTSVGAY